MYSTHLYELCMRSSFLDRCSTCLWSQMLRLHDTSTAAHHWSVRTWFQTISNTIFLHTVMWCSKAVLLSSFISNVRSYTTLWFYWNSSDLACCLYSLFVLDHLGERLRPSLILLLQVYALCIYTCIHTIWSPVFINGLKYYLKYL